MPSKTLVPVISHISPEEKAELQALAKQTNISVSRILRRLLDGKTLPDPAQQALGQELVRLRADMARLGNLFKMALDNEEFERTAYNKGINALDIIDEIRATKDLITQAIKRL